MKKNKPKKISLGLKIGLIAIIVILVAAAAFVVLKKPRTVQMGDNVTVNYILTYNGTVIDTNIKSAADAAGIYNAKRTYAPMAVQVGAGKVIKGFDDALYGMKAGETKTVTVPPELAYGNYDPSKVLTVNKTMINNSANITVGTVLRDKLGRPVIVTAVGDTTFTVDTNSVLAGKTLVFDISLVEIKK